MLAQLDRLHRGRVPLAGKKSRVSQLHTAPPSAVAAVAMPGFQGQLRRVSEKTVMEDAGSLYAHSTCLKTPEEEAPTKLPSTLEAQANVQGECRREHHHEARCECTGGAVRRNIARHVSSMCQQGPATTATVTLQRPT